MTEVKNIPVVIRGRVCGKPQNFENDNRPMCVFEMGFFYSETWENGVKTTSPYGVRAIYRGQKCTWLKDHDRITVVGWANLDPRKRCIRVDVSHITSSRLN